MELIGGNEGVDRVAEQQQICLLQLCAEGREVFLIAFDALAHRENGKGVLRVQGLQIQGGVDGGRVLALGAGI